MSFFIFCKKVLSLFIGNNTCIHTPVVISWPNCIIVFCHSLCIVMRECGTNVNLTYYTSFYGIGLTDIAQLAAQWHKFNNHQKLLLIRWIVLFLYLFADPAGVRGRASPPICVRNPRIVFLEKQRGKKLGNFQVDQDRTANTKNLSKEQQQEAIFPFWKLKYYFQYNCVLLYLTPITKLGGILESPVSVYLSVRPSGYKYT